MSYAGYGFNNMSSSDKKTVYHPTSSLLVIDSEDRNVSSSIDIGASTPVEFQRWNNFQIQTPDRLATGAINNIKLKSVRFPWYIPNITDWNNSLDIQINGGTIYTYNLSPGFYSPSEIATALNDNQPTNGITWVWSSQQSSFYVDVSGAAVGVPITFIATNLGIFNTDVAMTSQQFVTLPSLARTLGFTLASLNQTYTSAVQDTVWPTGYTDCLYTHYVDIVSPRLLQYRSMIDGASKNTNKKPIITRIYCANENSQNSYDLSGNIIPVGTQPFLIFRKMDEKSIRWNSEATVDYLDFQVYDEFGRLVIQPVDELGANPIIKSQTTYPSFQMTFVLSE